MISGQCNCGAVSFEIVEDISQIYVCHCSICRRFTGGGGIPVVVVKNEVFVWKTGCDLVKIWKKPDADWESNFCSICGSSMPGQDDAAHMFIPAGALQGDVASLRVAHHIFVGSKAEWDQIGDTGKQHQGRFVP